MSIFIKKKFEIQQGAIILDTREGDSISGSFSMDDLFGSLSFNLPYNFSDISQLQVDEASEVLVLPTRLKKFNFVKLYYAEVESDREPTNDEWKLIFDGFIESIKLQKTKTSIKYVISLYGTLGLSNYRTLSRNVENITIQEMPNLILQRSNLQAGEFNELPEENQEDIIPSDTVEINLDFLTDITAKSIGAKESKQALAEFKDRYGLIYHQHMDGSVEVTTPVKFLNQSTVDAWEFDTDRNIYDLDYGDLTTNIDGVLIYGFPPSVGEALDITTIQSKGIPQNPDGTYNLNLLRLQRRDLFSEEECQEVARNILLEQTRNFLVTIKVPFNPNFKIGDTFTVNDHDIYSGSEIFFIKNINYALTKNDVSCVLQGYTHSLTTLPEDIVIAKGGAADVDTLELRNKVVEGDWQVE